MLQNAIAVYSTGVITRAIVLKSGFEKSSIECRVHLHVEVQHKRQLPQVRSLS
jgi:hypothetical protein